MSVGIGHFLVLSSMLFAIGLFGVLARRNILGILMAIELMFNAAALNFIAFNRMVHTGVAWGQGFAIFIIALAAAEAVVGLALVLAIYRGTKNVFIERMNLLKG